MSARERQAPQEVPAPQALARPTRAPILSRRGMVVSRSWISLVQRTDLRPGDPLYWALPGGRPDSPDEEPVATVLRELDEEIKIKRLTAMDLLKYWYNAGREGNLIYDLGLFLVGDRKIQTVESIGNENGKDLLVRLFPRNEVLERDDIRPSHRPLIELGLNHLTVRGL